ncbi:hypothetical protein [Amaricoccus tamworthensis]|uniref:hypothetical protein n=1 Tax=Amaricoccus tamworthensis TaxID=57002 RepID=UPI003C7C3BC4
MEEELKIKSKEFQKWRKELSNCKELFAAAFDELHNILLEISKNNDRPVKRHYDYPRLKIQANGFPQFYPQSWIDENAPINYMSLIRSESFLADAFGIRRSDLEFPLANRFADFLRGHNIGKKLGLKPDPVDGNYYNRPVEKLIESAVERYIQIYGLKKEINCKNRTTIISPLIRSLIQEEYFVSLIVPITLTNFDANHFQLTPSSYVFRMPKNLQLSRGILNSVGSGTEKCVVSAATHAFLSNGWSVYGDQFSDITKSLAQHSDSIIHEIDRFLEL